MDKKKLAAIGGGAAGHQIAHDLGQIMIVTLIYAKTYWEVSLALTRLLVKPDPLSARLVSGKAGSVELLLVPIVERSR